MIDRLTASQESQPVTGQVADGRLCPSARCEEEAIMLGVIGRNGMVGYVTPRISIDEDFVNQAHEGRTPEKRFRFAQPCVEGRCLHWSGRRCKVIDRAMDSTSRIMPEETPAAAALPKCSIRIDCRWFAQSGPAACRVCPWVITDLRPENLTVGLLHSPVKGIEDHGAADIAQ